MTNSVKILCVKMSTSMHVSCNNIGKKDGKMLEYYGPVQNLSSSQPIHHILSESIPRLFLFYTSICCGQIYIEGYLHLAGRTTIYSGTPLQRPPLERSQWPLQSGTFVKKSGTANGYYWPLEKRWSL